MRFVELKLLTGSRIFVNPECVQYVQENAGGPATVVFVSMVPPFNNTELVVCRPYEDVCRVLAEALGA
jgi:hypothetical protein